MKKIALLVFLCLAILPMSAQVLYDNGPVNGTQDGWTINFGYVVSDTFVLTGAGTVGGFDFYTWTFPGDTTLTVDWQITSAEFGGTNYGSGTAAVVETFISSNQYGYNVNKDSVGITPFVLAAGTYWLNLDNATVASGDPVYWDENSGPSMASESALGTVPSEAFDIVGTTTSTNPTTVPEPSSILLFGSGILGLAGVLRRKLF